jgi:hypothetical protein
LHLEAAPKITKKCMNLTSAFAELTVRCVE